MAIIRATCGDCGDVEMTSDDVIVRVCADNGQGAYAFRCPECHMAVSKPAENRVIELLIASGIRPQLWRLPEELREEKDGPALDHDDLLNFHRLLAMDDEVDKELRGLMGDAWSVAEDTEGRDTPPDIKNV